MLYAKNSNPEYNFIWDHVLRYPRLILFSFSFTYVLAMSSDFYFTIKFLSPPPCFSLSRSFGARPARTASLGAPPAVGSTKICSAWSNTILLIIQPCQTALSLKFCLSFAYLQAESDQAIFSRPPNE